MQDINDALMRRVKLTPVKCKRSATSSSKKVPSTSTGASIMRLATKPLDEASQPTTTRAPPPTRAGSPRCSASSQVSCLSLPTIKPSKQAYIDLGQKDFGKHITCRTCGLLYTAGEEEDEREHQRFCRQRQKGLTIAKWKNERVLRLFPDDDARIIEIRANDPPLHVKKMLEVKEILDDALGFVSKDTFLQRGLFVFIQAKQIVGCVTVERIQKAIVLRTDKQEQGDTPAVVGICQLWVLPEFRGKAIATRLVDVVREKYIYGLLIPKNRVAFAQPTRNGLAFATCYVAPHPVLVYEAATEAAHAVTTATSNTKRRLLG